MRKGRVMAGKKSGAVGSDGSSAIGVAWARGGRGLTDGSILELEVGGDL
jgi:hypothetical protein